MVWMRAVRDYTPKPPANSSRYGVLWALALRLDATGQGYASQRQLAGDVVVNERTVRRHLDWARTAGYLVQTRRGHRIKDGTAIASEWRLSQPDMGVLLGEPAGDVTADSHRDIPTGQSADPTGQTGIPNRTRVSAPEVYLQEVCHSLPLTRDQPSADRDLPLSRAQRERRADIDLDELAKELDSDFDATGYMANHNWCGDTGDLIDIALHSVEQDNAINDARAWLATALEHRSPVGKAVRLLQLAGDDDDE